MEENSDRLEEPLTMDIKGTGTCCSGRIGR